MQMMSTDGGLIADIDRLVFLTLGAVLFLFLFLYVPFPAVLITDSVVTLVTQQWQTGSAICNTQLCSL